VRVDQSVNSNPIIQDIKNMIETSEFIILDLTHENPNVYYELGYVDGVGNEGKEVLLLAQKDTKLHFNIADRRIMFYKDAFDLQEQLKTKLPQFRDGGRK
jgi:superfamily I DNA and RNA helicase